MWAGSQRVRLTPDELTAYYALRSNGWWRIVVAKRSTTTEPFGEPAFPDGLHSATRHDFSPSPARGGRVLYFDSHNGNNGDDWYTQVSTRDSLTEPFSSPAVVFLQLSGAPYALDDDSAVYFHSWSQGLITIFRSEHRGPGYTQPLVVLPLRSMFWNRFPVVTNDELTLYFSTDDADMIDLWVATRSSKAESFGRPTLLDSLSTNLYDMPSWISPDGCRLYFDRTPDYDDVRSTSWVAERIPPGAEK